LAWTVSRRIAVGFALMLGLGIVLAVLGVVALRNSTSAYRSALEQEREVRRPALQAESAMREATVQFLRFLLTREPRFAAARDSSASVSRTLVRGLRDTASTPERRARWSEVLGLLDRWDASSRQAVDLARAGRQPEALRQWDAEALPLRLQLREAVERQLREVEEQSAAIGQAADASSRRMERTLLVGALLALLVGIGSALLLDRAVSDPLRETTGVLASSAAEILAATTQQASSASETSAAVVQTSTTIDEVTQTAEQAAERARAVADSAQRAAEIGRRGRSVVEETITTMSGVKEQVESIAESILALTEQAQAIGEIITTVNDIADQTNLLALNAAVEAARAGEHGRGFAVVAGEVRNRADQSKKATVQVRQILGEIQRAMNAAAMTTERGTQLATAGASRVEEAGDTIRALADAVTEAAHSAAQIVASAGQQAVGMGQIRQAMGDVHGATQQTLASIRQAEEAAQDLNRLGGRLLSLVGRSGPRNGRLAGHA
jgi:methyl-accepting chemotaxis protein